MSDLHNVIALIEELSETQEQLREAKAELERVNERIAELEVWRTEFEHGVIRRFVEEVERRAEANMLKTGKLEGAHYAAMKQLVKELEAES